MPPTESVHDIMIEALEHLADHQWYLAYNSFREAVFHRIGARDADHHDSLPSAMEARDWLGLGERQGRALCEALAHDYAMARIMGGCYDETFADLYRDETTAYEAMTAAQTILDRCDELDPQGAVTAPTPRSTQVP